MAISIFNFFLVQVKFGRKVAILQIYIDLCLSHFSLILQFLGQKVEDALVISKISKKEGNTTLGTPGGNIAPHQE